MAVAVQYDTRMQKILTRALEQEAANMKKTNKDLTKTKLCEFFLRASECGQGDSCPFAHHLSEVRSAPDLSKTQLCAAFVSVGKCDKDNCSYAHGQAELRKRPCYKKQMCIWHQSGRCRNGADCGYAHNVSEMDAGSVRREFYKIVEPDSEASTGVSSSKSWARSDVSMASTTSNPEENMFRMMAGRGSAPLQNQVQSMGLAINDLQAKLAQIEEQANQTKVDQMKDTIAQLSQQCGEVEAQVAAGKRPSGLPQAASTTSQMPGSLQGQRGQVTSASKALETNTLWARLVQNRAALGALALALMVMVEIALRPLVEPEREP